MDNTDGLHKCKSYNKISIVIKAYGIISINFIITMQTLYNIVQHMTI